MNVLAGVALIAAFTLCGYRYSLRYKERKEFFRDFYSFNTLMITEVSFMRRSLMELNRKISFCGRFKQTLEGHLSGELPEHDGFLTPDEQEYLKNYFYMLGKSDSAAQSQMLKPASEILKNYMDDSAQKAAKYTALSVRLSFLFGLMAFILIV